MRLPPVLLAVAASMVLLGLLYTASVPSASGTSPSGPDVTLVSPVHEYVSNGEDISIRVAYNSDSQSYLQVGGVTTIDLYLDAHPVARLTDLGGHKQGYEDIVLDVSSELDSKHRLTAVVYQGDPLDGYVGEDAVSIKIDRPPVITIEAPIADSLVTDPFVVVLGSVNEASEVFVNEVPALTSGLDFRAVARLSEGTNLLRIEAIDDGGNATTQAIPVSLDRIAPQVGISCPQPNTVLFQDSITVMGSVFDTRLSIIDSGDCSVEVNGVPAVITGGTFLAENVPLAAVGTTSVHCCCHGSCRQSRHGSDRSHCRKPNFATFRSREWKSTNWCRWQ